MAQDKKTENAEVLHPLLGSILVKPRISEKAVRLNEANKYAFVVTKKANKVQVKKAIEQAYKVKVLRVNIINMEGKKRTYGRSSGKMSDFKKAIVTLKQGDKITGLEANI